MSNPTTLYDALPSDETVAAYQNSGPITAGDTVDEYPMTQFGAAERLANTLTNTARFSMEEEQWYWYTGTHWEKAGADGMVADAYRAMVQTLRSAYTLMNPNDRRTKALRTYLASLEKHETMVKVIKQLGTMPDVRTAASAFDGPHVAWLLNVENGTLDLRTGTIRPHDPNDLITCIAPVTHDPTASCPKWHDYLHRFLKGDQELITYLQYALGLAMVGKVVNEVFFVNYGRGQNGKSTLVKVLTHLLGTGYVLPAADPKLALQSNRDGEQATPGRASLKGKRVVIMSEPAAGTTFDDGALKVLASTDTITARRLHKDTMTFDPSHTVFLSTNSLPGVRDFSYGCKRRLKLVPFTYQIADADKIDGYADVLLQEASGILNWLIEGCLAWQANGRKLPPCSVVDRTTEDYFADHDVLKTFLTVEEYEVTGDPTHFVEMMDVFQRYRGWLQDRGVFSLPEMKGFTVEVKMRAQDFGIVAKQHPTYRRSCLYGLRRR
ncbi:MAG: DNA primase family protein [Armatimonadota bacterium]